MSSSQAPRPLPAGHGYEGLERDVRLKFGCDSNWVESYEVHIGGPLSSWIGFVHEFKLADSSGRHCFVAIWGGPGQITSAFVYLKDSEIPDSEHAVRAMLVDRAPFEQADRVSTS